jgi:hypothetical protein
MSSVASHPDDRLTELLADQALQGLTSEEELELETLLAAEGRDSDLSLAVAAAALELAFLRRIDPLPGRVARRLEKKGRLWANATSTVLGTRSVMDSPFPEVTRRATRLVWSAGPWMVAAACLILTLIAWWPGDGKNVVLLVKAEPDHVSMDLHDWDGDVKGVKGEVAWCDRIQQGYAKFENLPPNDPTREQYQLWIIDERGKDQRISGAVFDSKGPQEQVIAIKPGIPVRNPQTFTVTLEPPGGTWVSDFKRRVAIAGQ